MSVGGGMERRIVEGCGGCLRCSIRLFDGGSENVAVDGECKGRLKVVFALCEERMS